LKDIKDTSTNQREEFSRNRYELLQQLEEFLDFPMAILGFAWLALLVADLVWGLTSTLETLLITIWIIFIADFLIDLLLAPKKSSFLKANWLTIIALIAPGVKVFRFLRFFRFTRGLALTRVVSSINRSMRSLRFTMHRRGFGYVVALASIVGLAGSASMYSFERGINPDMDSFEDALWYAATAITISTDYLPYSPEGRILGFMLGLFSFGVSGYVTAALASYFIGRDAEIDDLGELNKKAIDDLRDEIQALRDENKIAISEIRSISEALNEHRKKG
jgi:voltage-gated potassium channel